MRIEKFPLPPTYKKDNGLWVLNTQTISFRHNFYIAEQSIVFIPPGQFGGNHKHPRQEAFIGIGKELQLIWQDKEGNIHKEPMNEDNLYLFLIPSYVPHAVHNSSPDKDAILYEYADDKQHDVEEVKLI